MIYITGATGFIGGRLAQRLLKRGARLRCLVRSPEKAAALRAAGAELVVGDVADPDVHRKAMQGARLAYHLAAIYDLGVVSRRAVERTNVDGTRAFLDAARDTAVPRAVYVSTTVALEPGTGDTEPYDAWDGPYPSHYHRTKAQAHRRARTSQAQGLPLIIVCPANVYGPGDMGPNGRFLRDLLRGRLPGLLTRTSRFSYVHVDDVADALVAAGETGRLGETYLLTGEAATVNEFGAKAAAIAGRRLPLLRFPPALARATGLVLDAIARPTGLRFPISREVVNTITRADWLHRHDRATRDLGYEPRSLDQGLPETVQSYLSSV